MKPGIDTARRLYGELVRGRTRVRVVTDNDISGESPASFILSPYRSGTTLLRYCLDSHPRLAVPPETDYFMALGAILQDGPSLVGLRDLGYDEAAVVASIARFGRHFLDVYAAGQSAEQWCDKSPRYAEDPEFLTRVFPHGRFIVLHRHPLDQVDSFTKGGAFVHSALAGARPGEEVVLRAAEYWDRVTANLVAFSQRHPEETIVITYEDLCADPEGVLGRVLEHLGLEWSTEVLNYHAHDHDVGREAGRVSGTVGFAATTGRWQAWPDELVQRSWEIVSATAEGLDYDH